MHTGNAPESQDEKSHCEDHIHSVAKGHESRTILYYHYGFFYVHNYNGGGGMVHGELEEELLKTSLETIWGLI